MSLEVLSSIVPQPELPQEVKSDQHRVQVQEDIGIQLPPDYWDFAMLYGSGRFSTENFDFWIYNPFSPNYVRGIELDCDSLSSIHNLQYEVHPRRPGLLPWGSDVNGNILCWHTQGNPEEWPIMLCPETGQPSAFEVFTVQMTTFLANTIQGKLVCHAWQEAEVFSDGVPPRFVQVS